MIVNLIGPPGAGKSTFASRFVLEHPDFTYCPIDEYRIRYKNETQAWGKLLEDVVNTKDAIIESVGLSWRLNDIFNAEVVRRQRLYTIRFDVQDPAVLYARIADRQKRQVPLPPWVTTDMERQSAGYFWENSHRCAVPIDFTVYTDQGMDPQQQYVEVVNAINQARIDSRGNQPRRSTRYENLRLGNRDLADL